MSTITPEQFMTLSEPDEDDFERVALTEWSAEDPLATITEAIQRIEARLEAPPVPVVPAQDFDDAMQALADLGAKHDELHALLEEVEAILKPSTSKLAISIREAITRWRAPEVPIENAVEMGAHVPAHDAPVEEWREYARCAGFDNAESDLDTLNRSQIRTLLGIEQPA